MRTVADEGPNALVYRFAVKPSLASKIIDLLQLWHVDQLGGASRFKKLENTAYRIMQCDLRADARLKELKSPHGICALDQYDYAAL